MTLERTRVAIVGAGPAGLMLSHLLAEAEIESVILDRRSREEIEGTIRAGILEQGTVEMLDSIAGSRARSLGQRHNGIELHFSDERHRIDFAGLTGRSVWLYPQHEVLIDLIAARLRAGQDIRFNTTVERVTGVETDTPHIIGSNDDGSPFDLAADFVVGADGSRSVVRGAVTGSSRGGGYFREYPFAWFGVLCEAPPSSEELIYSNSPEGFALISQRSENVQRMYFQCAPDSDPNQPSEAEIWETLQSRVPGVTLTEGPIFQRDVLGFRSFVAHELRRGRAALVGDAAHTVPPTGAKGMNLAVADVVLLSQALKRLLRDADTRGIDAYAEVASRRIWKAQHFSWWMTSMLHTPPRNTAGGTADFDRLRQLGELRSVVESEAGRRYLAEAYTGWPLETQL